MKVGKIVGGCFSLIICLMSAWLLVPHVPQPNRGLAVLGRGWIFFVGPTHCLTFLNHRSFVRVPFIFLYF